MESKYKNRIFKAVSTALSPSAHFNAHIPDLQTREARE
jgi:hypothetical protein